MTVTAHSGAFDTPDNTLESIRKILDENCETAEVDVTFRPSGTPVIIHSDAPSEAEGVLLEDVFALVSDNERVKLNLDLKSTSNLFAVDELLKKYGLFDRAFYTGVFADWVERVTAGSDLPYYLNASLEEGERECHDAIESLCEKTKALGAIGINISYENAGPILIKIMHESGLSVSVWTVNDEETARKMIDLGVDNITTRKPDMIKNLMK